MSNRTKSFLANRDIELFLSLIDPDNHSMIINMAVEEAMVDIAALDLGEGQDPVDFESLLDREKAAICRQLSGRYGEPKCDEELWNLVTETTQFDLYTMTAKYLTLHRLTYGRPFRMPAGWRKTTATKPRASTKKR